MEMLNVCRGFESNHCNAHAMNTDSREKLKEYIFLSVPYASLKKFFKGLWRSIVQRMRYILSKILVYLCIISVYEKNGGSAMGGYSKGGMDGLLAVSTGRRRDVKTFFLPRQ